MQPEPGPGASAGHDAADAEATRLVAVLQLGLLDTPAEERFDRIARIARRLLSASGALVTLLDADRLWVKAADGFPDTVTPRAESFCTHTVASGRLFEVPDTRSDPVFAHHPSVIGDQGVAFYAGVPLAAAGGERVGTLCVFDTRPRQLSGTERRTLIDLGAWAELELRSGHLARAAVELDRVRRWTAMVLSSAAEAIIAVDRDGRVTLANPATSEVTGWEATELVGRDVVATLLHHHEDGTPVDPAVHAVTAALHRGEVSSALDDVVWRRDGSSVPVSWSVSPIEEDGAIVGAVVVAADATHRREVIRLKDEFLSVVSHELRTPLTVIRGSLGLLAAGVLGELPPPAAEMTRTATRNTDRLVRLVNDILDLEQFRAGRMVLTREQVDLRALAEQSVEGAVTSAEGSAGTPPVRVVGEPVTACVDPDRIEQALTNLIGNAVKFTGSAGAVTVSVGGDAACGRLTVADTGRGIPQHRLGSIFEPFEQVETGDVRKGGTGLGLAITRHVVEAHGGRITVRSEPGTGSEFTIELPAPAEDAGRSGAADAEVR